MRAERFPKLAKTTQVNYLSAYKHCNRLYNKKFAELKIGDLQAVIRDTRESGALYAMQKKVRQILHHCYTYAVKYEIISPTADISQYIDIDQHKVKYPKTPFNTRQINRVKNLGDKWAMTVLMMIYAGVRTSELLSILKKRCEATTAIFYRPREQNSGWTQPCCTYIQKDAAILRILDATARQTPHHQRRRQPAHLPSVPGAV